jgi:hypothetical protein
VYWHPPTNRCRCCNYADYFLKDTFLKYVGWSLNDKHAAVRLSALSALAQLYASEDNLAPMDTFSARFAERILQMTNDVDDGVVAKALVVLVALLQVRVDQWVREGVELPFGSWWAPWAVSGIPGWSCGHARWPERLPGGGVEIGKVEGVDAGCMGGSMARVTRAEP